MLEVDVSKFQLSHNNLLSIETCTCTFTKDIFQIIYLSKTYWLAINCSIRYKSSINAPHQLSKQHKRPSSTRRCRPGWKLDAVCWHLSAAARPCCVRHSLGQLPLPAREVYTAQYNTTLKIQTFHLTSILLCQQTVFNQSGLLKLLKVKPVS